MPGGILGGGVDRGGMDKERAFPVIRQTVLDTTDRGWPSPTGSCSGWRYQRRCCPDPASQTLRGQDWPDPTSPACGGAGVPEVGELPEEQDGRRTGRTWPIDGTGGAWG